MPAWLDHEDAEVLLEAGVDWLGFPLELPDGRQDLERAEAGRLIRDLNLEDRAVLITYAGDADHLARLCADLGLSRVQLHGSITPDALSELRRREGLTIIKSVVVNALDPRELMAEVDALQACDALITDTFDPRTGRRGATGLTHDWQLDRALVLRSAKPVIMAGGLTPRNVRAAILAARPAGVDAHTGVEAADGRKDPRLVREYVSEAKRAFREIEGTRGRAEAPAR